MAFQFMSLLEMTIWGSEREIAYHNSGFDLVDLIRLLPRTA